MTPAPHALVPDTAGGMAFRCTRCRTWFACFPGVQATCTAPEPEPEPRPHPIRRDDIFSRPFRRDRL